MTSTVRQSQRQPRSSRMRCYSQVYGDSGSAFLKHRKSNLREQTSIRTIAEFWCTTCGTPHCVPQLTHQRYPRFSLGHRAKAPRNKEDINRGWTGCGRPERKTPPNPHTGSRSKIPRVPELGLGLAKKSSTCLSKEGQSRANEGYSEHPWHPQPHHAELGGRDER